MPAAGLPIALEIVDETRVVETEGLLPRIGRHVAAISRQRLLRDAQRLAVGDGAGHSRLHELQRVPLDRRVHLPGGDDRVADHLPFRRLRVEDTLEEDALARELDADEPRQAQIGGAGNEALLAGRQVEIRAGLGEHAIHYAEELTAAADGE